MDINVAVKIPEEGCIACRFEHSPEWGINKCLLFDVNLKTQTFKQIGSGREIFHLLRCDACEEAISKANI